MDDTFINGYVASIASKFDSGELRVIRDSLYAYSVNWDIKPLKAELAIAEYALPDEYKYFILSKTQDGKLNSRSVEQYDRVLKDLLYFCKLPVKDITTRHLRVYMFKTFKNQRTGKLLSPYTANQRRAIIRSFFSWCCKNGFIPTDPAAILANERTNGIEPREAFTEEEIVKLKYACVNARERAIVELLLSTGVRAEEFVCIKRSDINMQDRSIRVLGKGNKLRTVYFNASTKVALEKYWTTLPEETEYAIVRFRRPYTKIARNSLHDTVKAIADRAGIEKAMPHRFRHTFATRLEERGCPIEVIKELLGHSEITTTLRYAHVSETKTQAEYNRYTT